MLNPLAGPGGRHPDRFRSCLGIVLRGDHLFDARVLAALINAKTNLVLVSNQSQSSRVRIINGNVHHGLTNFVEGGEGRTFSDFPLYELKDLDLSSLRQNLKKREALLTFCLISKE